MSVRRNLFAIVAVFLFLVGEVFALEIVPERIVGKPNEIGATSHDLVRCVLWDYYAPQNLVCGYFQISGSLLVDSSAHLTIRNGTNAIASTRMGAMETDNSTALYNFSIRRDLLQDSFIEVYARTQYVQLNLSTVRILTEQEYDKLTLSKALRPSHYVGNLPSVGTNTPSRKP
jgi:hypothetical protein